MRPHDPSHDPQDWRDEGDDAPETPERYWTARRILLILIALLILISLLAEFVAPILQSLAQPTPLPPFIPDAPRV